MSQFVSVSGGYSPVDSLMRQAARFPATVQKESRMKHRIIWFFLFHNVRIRQILGVFT